MEGYNTFKEMLHNSGGELDLWVCDYQQRSVLEKAQRNVKPTRVVVRYTDEHKAGIESFKRKKNTFYEMIAYKKNGELAKKNIPFYGTSSGIRGLHFFLNEDECVNKYNDLLFTIIGNIKLEKERVINQMENKIEQLQNEFVKSDYLLETLTRN